MATTMTPKENILAVLNHQKREWIPSFYDMLVTGFASSPGPAFEKGPGLDGFGLNWVTPASGGGAPIPEPCKFLLDSETIVDWKNIIHFPDVDAYDWKTEAEKSLAKGNPEIQAVDFGSGNGPFERMAALMGFEEALMAMAEEPEATFDLLNAIADYKIKVAERVHEYIHADTFTNYDDIATERDLFMSPDTYRQLIKPVHTKMYKAVRDMGMIPIQHTCGKADRLIQDFIETGVAAWTSVQPTNDIEGMLQKYGDQICLMGGYNSNGSPAREDVTDEEVEIEVKRCMDTYGKYDSYIFFGFRTVNSLDPAVKAAAYGTIIRSAVKYSGR